MPGIGAMSSPCASSQANAICAGVASSSEATASTSSTRSPYGRSKGKGAQSIRLATNHKHTGVRTVAAIAAPQAVERNSKRPCIDARLGPPNADRGYGMVFVRVTLGYASALDADSRRA